MGSLIKSKIWILVNRSKNQKIVDCKLVYKIKQTESNTKNKIYKTRLVPKGFIGRVEIYYNEIFSSVAKYTSSRTLPALTVHFDRELDQLNVKSSF